MVDITMTNFKLENNNPVLRREQQKALDKYRRILNTGAPMAYVEMRAFAEHGWNPDQLAQALNPKDQDEAAASVATKATGSNGNDDENSPPNLIVVEEEPKEEERSIEELRMAGGQKYRRMLKRGVSLPAVQQLAYVEGGWEPHQVAEAFSDALMDCDENNLDKQFASPTFKRPRLEKNPSFYSKYKRMIQAGIPMAAVEQRAKVDGIDREELLAALGLEEKTPVYFTYEADKSQVSFPSTGDLASLVRRLVQTVQKRATASDDKDSATMVVNMKTLYRALGALQGVQVARDRYNTTTTTKKNLGKVSLAQVRYHRQDFLEMARSIGMAPTDSFDTPVEIPGLDDLVECIKKVFQADLKAIQEQLEQGWCDFESLALLYPPGTKVVAKNAGGGGVDMICRVAWNRYEEARTITGVWVSTFHLCLHYFVAVDASHATVAEVVERWEGFEGRRSIASGMSFVPLAAYSLEEQENLLQRFQRRGEFYNKVALAGTHAYKAYEKGCFFLKRGGSSSSTIQGGNPAAALATGGRILVDLEGAQDYGHTLSVGYDPMVTGIHYKLKEYKLHLRSLQQEKHGQKGVTKKKASSGSHADDGMILLEQVPDDSLDLVWPVVVGFSLTSKAWGDVLIDGLGDIQFQNDSFDRLVLPESRKRMVKALVRHSSSTSFHDLVQGKGEGTVFLLYGPPGVGKTLTAEAIAEFLHKPLYSLSLATLGTTPSDLQTRLGEIMALVAKWDALLLLDEADSILETRSSASSLEHNGMVSVMLKLVEYYPGIMFLTSNRMDALDPAFQTRITLALRYYTLDREARTQIWKNLLTTSGYQGSLEDGILDPDALSQADLNGREIKNALRLAMAMAAEEGMQVSQDILQEAVDVVSDSKATMMASDYQYGSTAAAATKKGNWFSRFLKTGD